METELWEPLKLFWPLQTVDLWKKLAVEQPDTETCHNLVCMATHVQKYWDQGMFALKPIRVSENKMSLTCEFYWMPPHYKEDAVSILCRPALTNNLSSAPLGGKIYNTTSEKKLCSADEITFTTVDPVGHPLPSWDLLELQWIRHRIAALSGAAESKDDDEEIYDSHDE